MYAMRSNEGMYVRDCMYNEMNMEQSKQQYISKEIFEL